MFTSLPPRQSEFHCISFWVFKKSNSADQPFSITHGSLICSWFMNLWCAWPMFIFTFSSISVWAAKLILDFRVPSFNHWHNSFQLIMKITQALSAVSTVQMFLVVWFGHRALSQLHSDMAWKDVTFWTPYNKISPWVLELAKCVFINNKTFNSCLYQKVNDIVK